MPSPIESTVPVSATSISRPYSLISRFRMSVISPGLMSILSDPSFRCARLGAIPGRDPLACASPRGFLPRQIRAQLAQLRPQTPVEDQIADLRDDAAEQARVGPHPA